VLHSFSGLNDGAYPFTGLVSDASGGLYGATNAGGPAGFCVVFKLTSNSKGTWTEKVLHAFRSVAVVHGTPIFDAGGNLYANVAFGGSASDGTVFKLAPQSNGSWTYSVLHTFVGKPSESPIGELVMDLRGHLYGLTELCRSGCQGVVFEITQSRESLVALRSPARGRR